MTEERGPRGIEIPQEVAGAAGLPDDLDASLPDAFPYSVPDPARRRHAGAVYLVAAGIVAAGIGFGDLPVGMWLLVSGFLVLAAYHWLAAWHLEVREGGALEAANRAIGFPVGHASASLGFYGWRSRPVWNVLVFSADDPPADRGLVRVDGISGDIIEQYAEPVPTGEPFGP